MKTLKTTLLFATLAVLAAGLQPPPAIAAERVVVQVPRDVVPAASALSRAEVQADLHMWRLAGLQAFTRNEQLVEQSDGYQAALARYRALRASPDFTALVEKLQGNTFVWVTAR